jgi:hypothetical protein
VQALRFSVTDPLIAGLAHESGAAYGRRPRFRAMASLGLVQCYGE